MPKALIAIQAEKISDEQIVTLERLVLDNYKRHVGGEKLLVVWNKIPEGQAFTDYKDSNSSLITMECGNSFPQEKRVAMLTELEAAWREVTGQHPDEVMLALVEQELFQK